MKFLRVLSKQRFEFVGDWNSRLPEARFGDALCYTTSNRSYFIYGRYFEKIRHHVSKKRPKSPLSGGLLETTSYENYSNRNGQGTLETTSYTKNFTHPVGV